MKIFAQTVFILAFLSPSYSIQDTIDSYFLKCIKEGNARKLEESFNKVMTSTDHYKEAQSLLEIHNRINLKETKLLNTIYRYEHERKEGLVVDRPLHMSVYIPSQKKEFSRVDVFHSPELHLGDLVEDPNFIENVLFPNKNGFLSLTTVQSHFKEYILDFFLKFNEEYYNKKVGSTFLRFHNSCYINLSSVKTDALKINKNTKDSYESTIFNLRQKRIVLFLNIYHFFLERLIDPIVFQKLESSCLLTLYPFYVSFDVKKTYFKDNKEKSSKASFQHLDDLKTAYIDELVHFELYWHLYNQLITPSSDNQMYTLNNSSVFTRNAIKEQEHLPNNVAYVFDTNTNLEFFYSFKKEGDLNFKKKKLLTTKELLQEEEKNRYLAIKSMLEEEKNNETTSNKSVTKKKGSKKKSYKENLDKSVKESIIEQPNQLLKKNKMTVKKKEDISQNRPQKNLCFFENDYKELKKKFSQRSCDLLKNKNFDYSKDYFKETSSYSDLYLDFLKEFSNWYLAENPIPCNDSKVNRLCFVAIGSLALRQAIETSDLEFVVFADTVTLELLKWTSCFLKELENIGVVFDNADLFPPIFQMDENNLQKGSLFTINNPQGFSNYLHLTLFNDTRINDPMSYFEHEFPAIIPSSEAEVKKIYHDEFILPKTQKDPKTQKIFLNLGTNKRLQTIFLALRGINEKSIFMGTKELLEEFEKHKNEAFDVCQKQLMNTSLKSQYKDFYLYFLKGLEYEFNKHCKKYKLVDDHGTVSLTLETIEAKHHFYRLVQLGYFSLPLWRKNYGEYFDDAATVDVLTYLRNWSSYLRMKETVDHNKGMDRLLLDKVNKSLQFLYNLLSDSEKHIAKPLSPILKKNKDRILKTTIKKK